MKIAILVPVWHNYLWIAPITMDLLEQYWPNHPPIWFCGMTREEAGELPVLPWSGGENRTNWTAMLQDGAGQLKAKGVDAVYLILEEHVPLAPCQEVHLNETLPSLLHDLPAVYVSLMGWDNRRYTSRSPLKGPYRLQHLTAPRDPRFHLHPALWKIDALEACCETSLRDPAKNGSAWHFEKSNDRAPHPGRDQCYQICSGKMRLSPPGPAKRLAAALEQFVFRKLMALYPLIPHRGMANGFARLAGFDNVYCDGPYPMFFSGIMAKGHLNPFLVRFLRAKNPDLLSRLIKAAPVN